MTDTVLTPDQVATRLQVNPRTVSAWLKTGRLRGSKVGRLWRIPSECVDEFLLRHMNRPKTSEHSGMAQGDPSPTEWSHFVALAWRDELADESQDIYTLEDGEPIDE